jgi:NAD(P)H-nitrite reductase large subunit
MNTLCTPDHCDNSTERIVCRCLQITETELIQVLTNREVHTVKEICRLTKAGDGCTACHSLLKQYIDQYT